MSKDIVAVQCLASSRLLLTFEDDEPREIDVSAIVPFRCVFEPLRDDTYFWQVRVNPEIGTIVWPNRADLCPDVLYEKSTALNSHG